MFKTEKKTFDTKNYLKIQETDKLNFKINKLP